MMIKRWQYHIFIYLSFMVVFYFSYLFLNKDMEVKDTQRYNTINIILSDFYKNFSNYNRDSFIDNLDLFHKTFNKYNQDNPMIGFILYDDNYSILKSSFYLDEKQNLLIEEKIQEMMIDRLTYVYSDFRLSDDHLLFLKKDIKIKQDNFYFVYVFKDKVIFKLFQKKINKVRMGIVFLYIIFILLFVFRKYLKVGRYNFSFFKKNNKNYKKTKPTLEKLKQVEDVGQLDSSMIEKEPQNEVPFKKIDKSILTKWDFTEKTDGMGIGSIDDIRENQENLEKILFDNDLYLFVQSWDKSQLSIEMYKGLLNRLQRTIYYFDDYALEFYDPSKFYENVLERKIKIEKEEITINHSFENKEESMYSFYGPKIILGLNEVGVALKKQIFFINSERNDAYFPIVKMNDLLGVIRVLSLNGKILRNQVSLTSMLLTALSE